MPYLIDTHINAARSAERDSLRAQHLAFLEASVAVILAAGAKLLDDDSIGPGSFYLVDLETRAEAEAFLASDPYASHGLIDTVAMTRVRQGFFNHQRHHPPEKAR